MKYNRKYKSIFKNSRLNEEKLYDSDLFEDDEPNETTEQEPVDNGMTDEELKVESLTLATKMAKLMSNVTPDDMFSIAHTIANFIKNHNIGSEYDPDNQFANDMFGEDEDGDEKPTEETIEEPEDFDVDFSEEENKENVEPEETEGEKEEESAKPLYTDDFTI